MKTIEEIKLKDTVPHSIKDDPNVSAMSEALDVQLQKIAGQVDLPFIYARLDKLPGAILDHLAKQFNVSPWRDYWSETLKRNVIKSVIATKRKRGTLHAVKKCLEGFGSTSDVIPWYEQTPPGIPGTFKISVVMRDNGLTSVESQEDIKQMIDEVKPLTRHYEIIITQALSGGINVCGCFRTITYTKLCNF